MGLGHKINNILDYKISIDINTRIRKKTAVIIIVIITAALIMLGYFFGEAMFWGVDDRSVFDRRIEALERAGEGQGSLKSKAELAFTYYLKGEREKAGEIFEKVLKEEKNDADANIYYGLILADQKQYRDALPHLLRGVNMAPRREKLAYIYLGISYYELGGFDQALEYLDSGTKLDPGSALGYYYLGLTYKKRGDVNNAKAALAKALTLTGNNYPEASRNLKELTGKQPVSKK